MGVKFTPELWRFELLQFFIDLLVIEGLMRFPTNGRVIFLYSNTLISFQFLSSNHLLLKKLMVNGGFCRLINWKNNFSFECLLLNGSGGGVSWLNYTILIGIKKLLKVGNMQCFHIYIFHFYFPKLKRDGFYKNCLIVFLNSKNWLFYIGLSKSCCIQKSDQMLI